VSSSDVGRFFESPARLKQQQRDMTGLQSQQVAAAACISQQMLQQQREGQCVLAPVAWCRAVMWGAYVKTQPLKQQREDHLRLGLQSNGYVLCCLLPLHFRRPSADLQSDLQSDLQRFATRRRRRQHPHSSLLFLTYFTIRGFQRQCLRAAERHRRAIHQIRTVLPIRCVAWRGLVLCESHCIL
jgi:hypothetical protein